MYRMKMAKNGKKQMAKGNRCSSTTKLDSWKIKVGISMPISLGVNLVSVLRKKVRKQGEWSIPKFAPNIGTGDDKVV